MKTYPMAFVVAPGIIEFQEKILPELAAKDVLIQVKTAAICGSDLHIFKGKHPSAPLPVAIGHELAGSVIDSGKDVTRVKVGDRVTIEPVLSCGACEFCRRGQYHLCVNISFQYRKGQGAFTPFFIVNEDRAYKLPEKISFDEGALIEPLSVAVHAIKKAQVRYGQTCAIFGAGAIGLLILLLARQAGAGDIFISDIQPFRLEKALKLGATQAIHSGEQDILQIIQQKTLLMGVDLSVEAVGIEKTLVQALQVLKKGGKAILLGIFEDPLATIPANLFVQKEISLCGSQGYNWDFQDSISLLEQGLIQLFPLITHRLPLERLQDGFELLSTPGNQAIKVIIQLE